LSPDQVGTLAGAAQPEEQRHLPRRT
jgi:hypothetical protein